jgi:predicted transcriptional regulator of viral defense system
MHRSIEQVLRDHPHPYLTDIELRSLLDGTPNSRYGKVKRMLAQGKLLHVRRGLYCITKEIGYTKLPHSFALAQYIYGPSFISLESALSYHGLIPEAVYTTTSACGRRSKEFDTPLGIFSFQQVPLQNLYTQVLRVDENGNQFFIAKPWRAICDYVYCYRKGWQGIDPLINSLRIEPEDLPELHDEECQLLVEYYQRDRVRRFLKGVQADWRVLKESGQIL